MFSYVIKIKFHVIVFNFLILYVKNVGLNLFLCTLKRYLIVQLSFLWHILYLEETYMVFITYTWPWNPPCDIVT